MNLSNYLQMPPAPQSPAPAGTSSTPPAASLVGVDAAGRFKLDFARIMAQQFQQLPAVKRQDLAAVRASLPGDATGTDPRATARDPHDAETPAQKDAAHDTPRQSTGSGHEPVATTRASLLARAVTGAHSNARSSASNTMARQASTAATPRHDADASDADDSSARRSANLGRASARRTEDDTPLPWATALATPLATTNADTLTDMNATASVDWAGSATAPSAWRLPDGTQLQSSNLSPDVQIVTDPSRAPTPQSLLNFAREMGLNDASLRQLVGEVQGPLTQTINPSTPGGTNAAGWLATHLLQQATLTPTTGQPLPNAMPLGGAEWLQAGWLPNAPTAANPASGTVTLDVLTLSGADLPQAQITALAESFLAGDEGSSSSDQPEPQDGQPALAAAPASTAGQPAGGPREVNANNPVRPMAEVYQQLSDKLSNEMAARMHQQINAGEWKMKFGLRPAHLGSVEIQLEMKDGKLHADLAADNPLTRELLQNGSQRLRESLANLGIQAERVSVGQGQTLFGQGQAGAHGQGASQRGQLEDNSNPSMPSASAVSEPTRSAPKDPDGLLDLYA